MHIRKRFVKTNSSCCFSPGSGNWKDRALTADPVFKVHIGVVNPGSSYFIYSFPLQETWQEKRGGKKCLWPGGAYHSSPTLSAGCSEVGRCFPCRGSSYFCSSAFSGWLAVSNRSANSVCVCAHTGYVSISLLSTPCFLPTPIPVLCSMERRWLSPSLFLVSK